MIANLKEQVRNVIRGSEFFWPSTSYEAEEG